MADDPDHLIEDEDGFLPSDSPPPWGTESDEQRLSRLLRKARDLPKSPGVYLMKDHKGVVLYVGKAANLPDRTASYFVPSADLGPKKQPMRELVHDFEVLLCEGEWEALLTENRLIKDIRPRFNVRLIDDKTFPYLVVTKNEDFPRVFITRNPTGLGEAGDELPYMKGARLFGPFTHVSALREALQIMQRIFKFRTCKLDIIASDEKNRFFRPCILHAIGQCTAPCADKISPDRYAGDIDRLTRFLGSKRSAVLREMQQEMEQFSSELKFEQAAAIRDQIKSIRRLAERGNIRDGWQPESELGYIDPLKGPKSLAKTLGLEQPPRCIEAIDIAHLQGGETVGSKVCFIDGKPFKDEYRRYRIRSVEGGNDDYASIREVVSRRYREAGQGHELYPDVILIDGGLGQLHAAMEALEGMDRKPPMIISLAKKEELIFVQERSEPIRLGRENLGLKLCQAIRDEAHRFAQHYHHILRRKKTIGE